MTDVPVRTLRTRLAAFATLAFASSPFVCCFGSCLANFGYMVAAPPITHAVAFVEASPEARAAFGDDVSVSLVVTRDLDRSLVPRDGRERVSLITVVEGSRGEGMLYLDAENVDHQGWAGRFHVDRDGRRVLRNGSYETEGGGTVLAGTFAPDGTVGAE